MSTELAASRSKTLDLELLDLWALLESVAREKFSSSSQTTVDELVHAAVETALHAKS